MRYGLALPLTVPIGEVAELAAQAERAGFDQVWLADHYFNRDVSVALALMADATETITLGTAVMSPFLRHPTLLASLAGTLTEMAGPRFILGLGSGGYEFPTQMNVKIRKPLAALRDTVEIVRAMSVGRSEVSGEVFTARGAELRWRSDPAPVYMAARGPRMLALAGEIAEGVITHGISNAHIEYVRDRVGFDRALCLMLDVELEDDREKALDALRPRCVTMAGGAYSDDLIEVYGLNREAVIRLRRAVEEEGVTKAARFVTDDMAQAFGIAGNRREVTMELERISRAGVDAVILSTGGHDAQEVAKRIQQLAEVLP